MVLSRMDLWLRVHLLLLWCMPRRRAGRPLLSIIRPALWSLACRLCFVMCRPAKLLRVKCVQPWRKRSSAFHLPEHQHSQAVATMGRQRQRRHSQCSLSSPFNLLAGPSNQEHHRQQVVLASLQQRLRQPVTVE